MLIAQVGILIVLAYLTASGNVDILAKHFPPKFLAPEALLVYILIGLILVKYDSGDSPDVASLHEANTKLQNKLDDLEGRLRPRRLDSEQIGTISRTVHDGLAKLKAAHRAAGWSETDLERPVAIQLITIGSERETLDYRNDFAKAFEVGGFKIAFAEWPSTGTREFELFRGAVTVLHGDPRNVIRPFVLESLREARVAHREAEFLPMPRGGAVRSQDIDAQVVTSVVIGSRA